MGYCLKCGREDNRTKSGLKLCKRCFENTKSIKEYNSTYCKYCGKQTFFGEKTCDTCNQKLKDKKLQGSRCERVSTCRYRTFVDDDWHCGYILYAGHSRDCSVENCDKYISGDMFENSRKQLRMPSKRADAVYR